MIEKLAECRICKSKELKVVLDLGEQCLTGVFPKTRDLVVSKGPLVLVKCVGECGLVQLQHTYPLDEMYGENYGYRSGLNQSMVKHLASIVEEINSRIKLSSDDLVIDIGSNDSTLLKNYSQVGPILLGIDPSAGKFKNFYPENIKLIQDFFRADLIEKEIGRKKAKVITSISMFYDLPDPMIFVRDIKNCLDETGIWVFEQSYLPLMLKTYSFDTVCHEHLEFYALKQIEWMLEKNELKLIDAITNDVNGGSFRVVAAHSSSSHKPNLSNIEKLRKLERDLNLDSLKIWQKFSSDIENLKEKIVDFFSQCKKEGKKVIGLGASTKGNVLLQYCGISTDDLIAIAEVNEDKFGSFTPGTLIPIISEKSVAEIKPDFKFVLPWHFKESFLKREQNYMKSGGKLVFPMPLFQIEG